MDHWRNLQSAAGSRGGLRGQVGVELAALDAGPDGRPAARQALDHEAAAQTLRPLHHSLDPEVALFDAVPRRRIEAPAAIPDLHVDRPEIAAVGHVDVDRVGAAVPQGVEHRLLDHEEQVAGDELGHVVEPSFGMNGDPGGVSLADAVEKSAKRKKTQR